MSEAAHCSTCSCEACQRVRRALVRFSHGQAILRAHREHGSNFALGVLLDILAQEELAEIDQRPIVITFRQGKRSP